MSQISLVMRPAPFWERFAIGLFFAALWPIQAFVVLAVLGQLLASDPELASRLERISGPVLVAFSALGALCFGGYLVWTRPAGRPREVCVSEAGYRGPRNRRAPRPIWLPVSAMRLLRWSRRRRTLVLVRPPWLPVQLRRKDFEAPDALDRVEQALRAGAEAAGEQGAWTRREAVAARIQERRPWATGVLLLVLVASFAREFQQGAPRSLAILRAMGAVEPGCVAAGEAWRLLSGPLLHLHATHLALNGVGLVAFGWPVENRLGPSRLLVVALGSALAGALASATLGTQPSVGFSGAVLGLLAASLVADLSHPGDSIFPRHQVWVLVALLISFQLATDFLLPGIDSIAHVAGAAAGALIGFAVARNLDLVRPRSSRPVRILAVVLSAGSVAALLRIFQIV